MDIRYVAGLFDGEGCVRIDKMFINRPTKPYRRFQLLVGIGLAYWPTIEALYASFGGTISRNDSANRKNPKNRINYSWHLWSGKARDFLVQIEPHLYEKRDQVKLAIEFQNDMDSTRTHFKVHRGEPPDKAEIHAYRDSIIEQLGLLKKRAFDIPGEDIASLRSKMALSN